MTDLPPNNVELVRVLADLNARIADLTEQAESIKTILRQLPPDDYNIDGRPALRITPTRRFDAKAALALVPEELREGCYTTDLDAAKIKEYLAPALVETCMVEAGKPKVAIL